MRLIIARLKAKYSNDYSESIYLYAERNSYIVKTSFNDNAVYMGKDLKKATDEFIQCARQHSFNYAKKLQLSTENIVKENIKYQLLRGELQKLLSKSLKTSIK